MKKIVFTLFLLLCFASSSHAVTVTPGVASNDSDFYVYDTEQYNSNNGGAVQLGEAAGGTNSINGGLRFQLNVPQGATITAAKVTVKCAENITGTVRLKIYANDVDTSAELNNWGEWDTAHGTLTTANVDWDIVNPVSGTVYDSSEIKTVVQEIVSRGGWAANNYLQLLIDNDGSTDWDYLKYYCLEHATEPEAVLTVTYTSATGVQVIIISRVGQ